MPYLSHILNTKIKDSTDKVIGYVDDIVIKPKAEEYTALEYLKIKGKKWEKEVYLPYKYVGNLGSKEITLKMIFNKKYVSVKIEPNCIELRNDVLDQQIVDIAGARVIRVNDLRLGDFMDKMCVLGIDISFKGLLRRLGLTWCDFFDLFDVKLIDWRQCQPVKGFLKLNIVSDKLFKLHSADLANIVEDLSFKHGSQLVESLDVKSAAKVLEEIDPNLQKVLLKNLEPKQIKKIIEHMALDEVVDLIKILHQEDANLVFDNLKTHKVKHVKRLIHYSDDTVGGVMTLDFLTVRPEWTVKKVIEEIKEKGETLRSLLYVYITDEDGKFISVLSLRRVLIAQHNARMRDVINTFPPYSILNPHQKITEVMNIMTKYDLYTAAVVNTEHKLVGVVSIDDIMRHLVPNA